MGLPAGRVGQNTLFQMRTVYFYCRSLTQHIVIGALELGRGSFHLGGIKKWLNRVLSSVYVFNGSYTSGWVSPPDELSQNRLF